MKNINNNQNSNTRNIILSIGSGAVAFIGVTLTLRQFVECAKGNDIYETINNTNSYIYNDAFTILHTNPLIFPLVTLLFGTISFVLYRNPNQQ